MRPAAGETVTQEMRDESAGGRPRGPSLEHPESRRGDEFRAARIRRNALLAHRAIAVHDGRVTTQLLGLVHGAVGSPE